MRTRLIIGFMIFTMIFGSFSTSKEANACTVYYHNDAVSKANFVTGAIRIYSDSWSDQIDLDRTESDFSDVNDPGSIEFVHWLEKAVNTMEYEYDLDPDGVYKNRYFVQVINDGKTANVFVYSWEELHEYFCDVISTYYNCVNKIK